MSKASDLLDDYVLIIPDCYRAPYTKVGPGGMIEKMSADKREILKTLKSEDLQNIRPDANPMYQATGKGRWGRLKAEQENKQRMIELQKRVNRS
jgi:hypothetical protein